LEASGAVTFEFARTYALTLEAGLQTFAARGFNGAVQMLRQEAADAAIAQALGRGSPKESSNA
jgi:hypothetical protein